MQSSCFLSFEFLLSITERQEKENYADLFIAMSTCPFVNWSYCRAIFGDYDYLAYI